VSAITGEWTPGTFEYQGHRIVRGWHVMKQTRSRTEFVFGNVWKCPGGDGQQSQWCRLCCERNGWTWVSPNEQYRRL
jgi:hypothetical protein